MLNVSRGWTVRASAAMALSVASEAFLVACASVLAHLVYHITAYHETGSLSRLGIYALLAGLSYALVVLMRGDHDSHFGMGKRVDTPDIFLIWNTAFVITLFILFISKTLLERTGAEIEFFNHRRADRGGHGALVSLSWPSSARLISAPRDRKVPVENPRIDL